MTRMLTSFAAAGALLVAGAGLSAAQAQGTWAAAPPLYGDPYYGGYGYGYGWGGPGPIGAVLAAPVVAAAGILGAAATVASAPFAAGYYADPYYDAGYYGGGYYGGGYYGAGYAPVGWGYNYGPTYVAYGSRPVVRRAAVVTRPYREVRAVRVSAPARARAVPVRTYETGPARFHRAHVRTRDAVIVR